MARAIDTRDAGTASASLRLRKSAACTFVAATGVFTVTAGFLNELAVGDIVNFSAPLTGGTAVSTNTDYYLLGPRWALGATTFKVSASPGGVPLTGGTDATVCTVNSGNLTVAADGVLAGNYVSQDSPLGR